MRTKILITGGTGLVGSRLSDLLTKKGHEVVHLSRKKDLKAKYPAYAWDIRSESIDPEALDVDFIVHLAGAGVADKRWTKARKEEIYNSRILSTRLLVKHVSQPDSRVKGLICASAIGIYGFDTGDVWVDENTAAGTDFLAKVVHDWEAELNPLLEKGIQAAAIRIGIVLSRDGGALPKIETPVRLGAAAALGSGQQYMSWVHIDDLCGIFSYAIENNLAGIFNAASPMPVTNQELTTRLAKKLRKPHFLPNVPTFVLRLMLGELAAVVVGGNRVSSEKIQKTGYHFQFVTLSEALNNLYK